MLWYSIASVVVVQALLAVRANAQSTSCENGGFVNGSSCACPPGFGGTTCADLACGGTIFDGSNRKLISNPTSSTFANLTASGCACENGWSGTGCNVCRISSACQSGFANSAAGKASATSSSGLSGDPAGQNDTLVCNTDPRVWAAGELSCDVRHPTIQATFPLGSTLTVLRSLNTSFTPIPNVTAFGPAGSGTLYAQLFYAGIEQFYCSASSCTQTVASDGSADWKCADVSCTCIKGTTYCGNGGLDLTGTIDGLSGALEVQCGAVDASNGTASCAFKQSLIDGIFGQSGLPLAGCTFGECVSQGVIDVLSGNNSLSDSNGKKGGSSLGGGVIAGLAVVGALVALALLFLLLGCISQRKARKGDSSLDAGKQVNVHWSGVSYTVRGASGDNLLGALKFGRSNANDDKVILDGVSGKIAAGQMMAILGPSGKCAGKTTLVEILAGKSKSGQMTGTVAFPRGSASVVSSRDRIRIGFVPQQDILPPLLTVREAIFFAANLRLPESVPPHEKVEIVERVIQTLGLEKVRDVRIGDGEKRGISGGEMRRVSIGLELVARPDVLILDEPTSGLDSVSASKVANVLRSVAHDTSNPIPVIASIHQPSSQLYQTFDQVMVLSHGQALYSGPGALAPAEYFAARGIPPLQEGYNVADYLLEVASDAPVSLYQSNNDVYQNGSGTKSRSTDDYVDGSEKVRNGQGDVQLATMESGLVGKEHGKADGKGTNRRSRATYAATFLTQFEALSWREWKILKRDKTLFLTHVCVASVLGVFVGGLYFNTGITIAGFQSRVGCLFFLGALVAFSCLSALYNVVATRPLFLRERSNGYYSPVAWLLVRIVFDVIPLRIVPTILVSTITYWMAGLADDAAHFFKFLFILVLYTLVMTLFNFLLGCLFHNGGIAILLSALTALYQMTYAGFFVHLNDIPPVLRWLQWLAPLKYTLEALSVNEVGAGLMIEDSLQGVPVDVSASLIMKTLFGFQDNAYYRDVLVLFAFIAGFGVMIIGTVWLRVRERR
ncbi:hypothetical protein PUNSTDRAFT_69957 [Punctularia strigosozonata HHB-11173 SS5]|uniref:uncharacterized protein n=1 Tax=Punctularia strigosozonata (strain HHB-11173) TaxID=741275 RepID=UPI0004417A76|nr:uncharacterized protein PUNSTDRAFT_69957 [Punctularia strigosozonata HHB-11173 SS5]EIN07867.1 hypothetical protein PUNSTDRAFT_69957 [Punctularia strigosozonata HHB-11173 SS5]